MSELRVGTAGWTIPRADAADFAVEGTHLQRYSSRFDAVEINSSFHRRHRASTYERWAASVPANFMFSVKIPKAITHIAKLANPSLALDEIMSDAGILGARLGCILVQLPPSLALDPVVAGSFFDALRERWRGDIACEPRHATWFSRDAEALLSEHRVARVAADPARTTGGGSPGGWGEMEYHRLHGSPRTYYSSYDDAFIRSLAMRLRASKASRVWCIFDNTASGAAARNALDLVRAIDGAS